VLKAQTARIGLPLLGRGAWTTNLKGCAMSKLGMALRACLCAVGLTIAITASSASATSTVTVVPKGLPPIPPATITGLKISPSAFFAAPSGATISKVGKKAKKTYGATISYSDSQPATTTFVIGTSAVCKRPPKATGKSARCTPVKETLDTFTNASKAGVNKLHFSGRIKGKELAKGSYTLEAIQTTASGRQLIAIVFKIKG
jgi:hypothetical protein